MKKVILLFILAAALSVQQLNARRAIVTGNVNNTKVKTMSGFYNKSLLSYEEEKQQKAIDKKGNFKLEFDLKELTLVYLIIDEQETSFYVQPGDSFSLNINYKEFDKSIAYSGRGSGKNNFFKAFTEKFILGHEQDSYIQNMRRSSVSFAKYCDSLQTEQLSFISNFPEKPDAAFMRYFTTELMCERANNKLGYAGFWQYANRKGDTLPEMPAEYYGFIKTIPLNNDTFIASPKYQEYIKAVASHYLDDLETTSGISFTQDERLQMMKPLLKDEKVIAFYEAALVYSGLERLDFSIAEKFYFKYVGLNTGSVYLSGITDLYNKVKKIAPGQPAPAFLLADKDGKLHSLDEFRGKIVYLDFWASWCGPCMMEMPHSKKLKEEFAGKDVVFLYISVDEDLASWKAAMEKQHITGTNINAPSMEHAVCKTYNITGIPAYFLIGRDGKIITNNPPRPSESAQITKTLAAALEK